MTITTKITALGGAHWDILGRAQVAMSLYDDVPGNVRRMVGGVAGPVAMKLASLDVHVDLMAYAGHDELGDALIGKLEQYQVHTSKMTRGDLPTDVYMGIEAPNGLIAAIADCHSLEAVSMDIVKALLKQDNSDRIVVVDGNLREDALAFLAKQDFQTAELILVPASPGKIGRFLPFNRRNDTSLYVNLREANALCNKGFETSSEAASALVELGYKGAVVSNGGDVAAHAGAHGLVTSLPPQITVKRFTGAGDTLTGHHIFATARGDDPQAALEYALQATAHFISHEDLDV